MRGRWLQNSIRNVPSCPCNPKYPRNSEDEGRAYWGMSRLPTSSSSVQSASLFPDLWMDQGPLNAFYPLQALPLLKEMDCSGIWCASLALPQSPLVPPPLYTWLVWTPTLHAQLPGVGSSHFWQTCSRLFPWHNQWWTTFLEILDKEFLESSTEFLRLLFSKPWLYPLRDRGAHTSICFRVLYLQTNPLLPQISGYSPCTSALIFLWLKFLCDFWPALWAPLTSVLPSTQVQMISPETHV